MEMPGRFDFKTANDIALGHTGTMINLYLFNMDEIRTLSNWQISGTICARS